MSRRRQARERERKSQKQTMQGEADAMEERNGGKEPTPGASLAPYLWCLLSLDLS